MVRRFQEVDTGDSWNYGGGGIRVLPVDEESAHVATLEHEATYFDSLSADPFPESETFCGAGEVFDQACFLTAPTDLWSSVRAHVVKRLLSQAVGDNATLLTGNLEAAFDIRSVTPVWQLRWRVSEWVFGSILPYRHRWWCDF